MQNDFIKLISCDKLCIYGSLAQEISMLVTSKNQLPITNWIDLKTQTLKHKHTCIWLAVGMILGYTIFYIFKIFEVLLRLDYMPLHYISLNLFAKCLYFQSIFILYYGSPKIWNFDRATKTEIMIIGLTTSCEII